MNKRELKELKTGIASEQVTILVSCYIKRAARKRLKELNFQHYLHTGKFLEL